MFGRVFCIHIKILKPNKTKILYKMSVRKDFSELTREFEEYN